MKVYLMADLEGVAGVLDGENWCRLDGRYFDISRELLTREVNAAVEGFVVGGATEVLVCDGHGCNSINPALLHRSASMVQIPVQLPFHGPDPGWPAELTEEFDFVAWVGQHAKAGTEYGHLAHTMSMAYADLSVNGISIGEFGKLAMMASELGIRAIFSSGDRALAGEAQELVPGIETVAVKRGTTGGPTEDLSLEEYRKRNMGAVHLSPEGARERIRDGAERAMRRAQREEFGLVELEPPFERVAIFRRTEDQPTKMISREQHPTSVIELMDMPFAPKPLEE